MADTYWEVVTTGSCPRHGAPDAAGGVRRLIPAAGPRLADAGLDLPLEQAARELAGRVPELAATTRQLRRQLHRGGLR